MGSEKITVNDLMVLRQMWNDVEGEHYGLTLARAAGLSTAALYNSLTRLEEKLWVKARWEEVDPVQAGRPPRKYYSLTQQGREGYRETLKELVPPGLF